jgi:non-specific protein-tyrosine kinase
VVAQAVTGTNAIRIRATSTVPRQAADAANAYAREYENFSRAQALQYLDSVGKQLQTQIDAVQAQIDPLDRQLADPAIAKNSALQTTLTQQRQSLVSQLTNLKQTLNQVQAQSAVPTQAAQLITPARVPTTPASPKPLRNGALGLVVGLLFGVALALLRDYFNDSITSKEDLDSSTAGLPMVGIIPVIPGAQSNHGRPTVVTVSAPTSPAAEAFRTLRVSIQFLSTDRSLQVVQVTSPGAGEGKTTTIANLGVALAGAGQRVCLCCCDLRRPRLHEFFGLSTDLGLTSVLTGDAPLSIALREVDDVPGLWILPAGPPTENPSEALSSNRTSDLVKALRRQFDVILIDSPPVLPVADAVVMSKLVDAVIVLATVGQTNRRALRRAIELLRGVEAPLVGTILNRVADEGTYGYGDGYYLYYEPRPVTVPNPPGRPRQPAGSARATRRP